LHYKSQQLKPGGIKMKNQISTFQISFYFFFTLVFLSCSSDVEFTPPAGSTDLAITHYSFGKMTIDGENYDYDLSISPKGKIQGFSVQDHQINFQSIKNVITDEVKILILGSGYSSMAILPSDTLEFLEKLKTRGIEVHIVPTSKAVNLFNSLSKKGLLVFFHLNC
jgi:hypothetical protein